VTQSDVDAAMSSLAAIQTPFPSENAEVVPVSLLMIAISLGEKFLTPETVLLGNI
jgi:hypothetical protein